MTTPTIWHNQCRRCEFANLDELNKAERARRHSYANPRQYMVCAVRPLEQPEDCPDFEERP